VLETRGWAAQIGEIKLSDDANPAVSLQLTGVDTESIIEQARNIDNVGNRQQGANSSLQLGVTDSTSFSGYEFEWRARSLLRGPVRMCELLTISKPRRRHVAQNRLSFDAMERPNDDLARLQDFIATGVGADAGLARRS
jgi:hypothetical protein